MLTPTGHIMYIVVLEYCAGFGPPCKICLPAVPLYVFQLVIVLLPE